VDILVLERWVDFWVVPAFLSLTDYVLELFPLNTSLFFNILPTIATIFQGNSLGTRRKWKYHCCLSKFIAFMDEL
jgi:hypothetical protein